VSVTKSPFNNPRTIVCIHCQYERAINDGIETCPECGKQGLVHKHHLAPRLRWLRYWTWSELAMVALLLCTSITIFIPGPLQMIGGFFPLLLIIATLQGFIGIFVSGAALDRKGLRNNTQLHTYTWIGMTLSIMLLLSIAITIGIGALIDAVF
jgi:hypothetical protein